MSEGLAEVTVAQAASNRDPLLEVKCLKTYFYTEEGVVRAVDGVSFSMAKGETIGIVGESGCGKSVTSLSIMRLIPHPPGKIVDGQIIFQGENLLAKNESEMRRIRGKEISMIFQEPMTSLNPLFTIGDQIMEVFALHEKISRKEARERTIEMLKLVGIPSPERRVDEYPHEMSGGMRQRVIIAMALACNPKLLIADEPATALDVTIQAQILELMQKLKERFGMAIMMITHNLSVVAEFVDKVMVMYAGQIVESATVVELFQNPLHPYTIGLLNSIPKIDEDRARLQVIEGVVPDAKNIPSGCRFHPRCQYAREICMQNDPDLVNVNNTHQIRCWKSIDFTKGIGVS